MAALDTPTYESTKAVAADLDKAEALEFDAGRPTSCWWPRPKPEPVLRRSRCAVATATACGS